MICFLLFPLEFDWLYHAVNSNTTKDAEMKTTFAKYTFVFLFYLCCLRSISGCIFEIIYLKNSISNGCMVMNFAQGKFCKM